LDAGPGQVIAGVQAVDVGAGTDAITDVLCRVGYLINNVSEIDSLVLNPLLVSPRCPW
jgi:hypothetical protein